MIGNWQVDEASNLCKVRGQTTLIFFDSRARGTFISFEFGKKDGVRLDKMGAFHEVNLTVSGDSIVVT